MNANHVSQTINAVRHFSRFYTRRIGLLTERYLDSPFSVAEARVVYELANHEQSTATELARELDLDPGYLSRILRDFKKRGLIDKETSDTDGRVRFLQLTETGREAFEMLNTRSHEEISAILSGNSEEDLKRLVNAIGVIEEILGERHLDSSSSYVLRPHQPGDMGWVVYRHGVLYAEEYGWNEQFEALVAGIVAKFIQNFDAARERCWIAEMDGEIVGSVFLVKQSETVAKLRLLYVEPKARGLGVGSHLVDECIRFARRAGFEKIMLWTNSVLGAARHIYEKAGFKIVAEEHHHSFGHDLTGETWELAL